MKQSLGAMAETLADRETPQTEQPASVRAIAARAMGWQSCAIVAAQIIQITVTLTAAALVQPQEFALWGVATVIFNAQNLVGSFGLGAALVYRDEDTTFRDAVDGSFLVTAAMGLGGGLALFLAASPIASLFTTGFSHQEVQLVIEVMSFVFAATTVSNVPQAVIEKTLNFRRRAVLDLLGSAAYAASAGIMLVAGVGIWSLIIGKVIQTGLLWSSLCLLHPCDPDWSHGSGGRLCGNCSDTASSSAALLFSGSSLRTSTTLQLATGQERLP